MNNVMIAKQTMRITAEKHYILNGEVIKFPQLDYKKVEVFPPEAGEELLERETPGKPGQEMCRFEVTCEDSFQAAHRYENAFVMNFANAHIPGGGFKLGATAQEEALCRCSTLYASIASQEAAPMYKYNNSHMSNVESDYMLLSPNVLVFRNENCELIEEPFLCSVLTVPAPNRYGAALFASGSVLKETFIRRIRIFLRIAAEKNYKNLILGAWGCGAFGNRPEDVSAYFRSVLIDEEFGKCFDNVCFAIYGKEDGTNIREFRKTFQKELEE